MKTILRSDNLTCPSCVAKIEKALASKPGVDSATVHFTTGRIEVSHDPARVGAADLLLAVQKAGYRAKVAAF
jgi:copper chaperone CopZ